MKELLLLAIAVVLCLGGLVGLQSSRGQGTNESGMLLKMRRRIALWLDPSTGFACFASSSMVFRAIFGPARSRHAARHAVSPPALTRIGTIGVLAFLSVFSAAAQQSPTTLDSSSTTADAENIDSNSLAPPTPDSNAIMGFERLGTWKITGNSVPVGFAVASTTMRTQGKAALSVTNAPDVLKLISQPVASTATALTGVGNSGALLQMDILIPAQGDGDKDDLVPVQIKAFVTSHSRNLNEVPLGPVSLNNYRAGIYQTIGFTIPESVSSALGNSTFADLVFELHVLSPTKLVGRYLFDHLRVHSVSLVQSPKGTPPPPGYGGSVDLVVSGNTAVTKSFTLGPTQIPGHFHLKMGTAGATTVQLQLGLDKKPSLTCTYNPDSADASDKSYVVDSCNNRFRAGDLVNANWVNLTIVGGNSTQQIRAQLAVNPMGDLTGAGLIPPMPTFWGDADTCTPAPVLGTVVTTSKSCANQIREASQIVTNYFNKVDNANPSPNWIATPVPEFARRHGNGKPTNHLTGGPITPSDPPFDTGGDLNPGGTFDAYWLLSGSLTPTAVTGTDENKTHFDATFAAHSVIFGDDVDVVDAKLVADTDSGETNPTNKPATSSGTLDFYVFGNEIPAGGVTLNPSAGFTEDLTWSQEYNLPPIEIWIFGLTLGATVDAELKAMGSAAVSGLDLSVTPSASLGGHVSGDVNLGLADGSVDAKVKLVSLSAPVSAQAKWVINPSPEICATTLNGSLKGDLDLSSGGGEVDLNATFGVCPFCYTDSDTLFKWPPLASESWNLFNDTIDTQLFGLPKSMCGFPITVGIIAPTSGATLSSLLPQTLTGSAKPNDSTLPYTSTYNWTFTPGANASTVTVSGGTTANPVVTFGLPTSGSSSTWTINMSATVSVTSAGGTIITETGTAAPVTITVTNLKNGVYISQVVGANGPGIPDSNGVLQLGNAPGTVTISGMVVGASGPLNTTFTVACADPNTCGTYAANLISINGSSTTPSATWATPGTGGTFQITMTTTAGGSTYGTTSVLVYYTVLF